MGWKTINGRRYYYRSKRERGRGVSEYVGAGDVAELISQFDAINRDERDAERYADRAERERMETAELAGPNPTPLERLLAERATNCWLQVYRYELAFEQARDLTIRQAEFHQRKIDGAHRRYLSALKTLATVRKLGLPAVQINVAKN